MIEKYPNLFQSERLVEVCFIVEMLNRLSAEYPNGFSVLDVGGVPSEYCQNYAIYKTLTSLPVDYKISDFRPGNIQDNVGFQMNLPVVYQGDFVSMDINEKFDAIIFMSSLEHFPQCTESDKVFRQDEDRRGFEKAMSLLNPSGKIIMTVPFGLPKFENYQQNYDISMIERLTSGTKILEQYTYELVDDVWTQNLPEKLGTLDPYGVGCFLMEMQK